MDTQHISRGERGAPLLPGFGAPPRRQGGRWENIRAKAKRRRRLANAVVIGTTAAVVALAALFNLVLSR
jgi:hypothetical protein